MLQQTTVAAVIPFYERWMARWPTLETLAAADEDEVLAAWQGLGYYRRAKQLLSGAKAIATSGKMPATSQEWGEVKGVGRYTSAAIASIAGGEAVPLVDGNVTRVYARLEADSSTRALLERSAWRWAERVLVIQRPGDWNQALMELGATVCRPQNPLCESCPVAEHCLAHQEGATAKYPTPPEPREWRIVDQFAELYVEDGRVALRRSEQGDWWAGLWTLPRVTEAGGREVVAVIRHVVTNHKITLSLLHCHAQPSGSKLHSIKDLDGVAMPSPDKKLLAKVGKFLGHDELSVFGEEVQRKGPKRG